MIWLVVQAICIVDSDFIIYSFILTLKIQQIKWLSAAAVQQKNTGCCCYGYNGRNMEYIPEDQNKIN